MAWMLVHLEDHDAMEFSGDFKRVSHLNGFRVTVFRRRDRVAFEEKTPAFSQGAFRRAREVGHTEFGVRPYRDRAEGAPVRIPQENHAASHTPEHAALDGQPALAERLRAGRLNELAPQISVKLGTGWPF